MSELGKSLIILGLLVVAVGLFFTFAPKLPDWFGKLPGDISIKRDNFSFYFPLTTCLIISAVLSFIMWLFKK